MKDFETLDFRKRLGRIWEISFNTAAQTSPLA
jgi:hypothetical protein